MHAPPHKVIFISSIGHNDPYHLNNAMDFQFSSSYAASHCADHA